MAGRFTTQDVARVPAGWKVRTVKAGAHRVRVAFPPGRRQKGSGEVVQVLHPRRENPGCTAMKNPAELVLMGANPIKKPAYAPTQTRPLTKTEAKKKAKDAEKLNGRPFKVVRVTYMATGESGWDITPADTKRNPQRRTNPMLNANFSEDEKLTLGRLGIKWSAIQSQADVRRARKALKEAAKIRNRFGNPMPMAEQRERAAEIYSGFHAREHENKLVMDEPHIPAGAYPELGLLYVLYFKPTNPNATDEYEKTFVCEKENVHMIGTLDRDHIYFAGGDQKLDDASLRALGWNGEDRFQLGTARKIVYLDKKYHDEVPKHARGKLVEWIHKFGEETGVEPELWYDRGNARLYLKHGEYEIQDRGIVN